MKEDRLQKILEELNAEIEDIEDQLEVTTSARDAILDLRLGARPAGSSKGKPKYKKTKNTAGVSARPFMSKEDKDTADEAKARIRKPRRPNMTPDERVEIEQYLARGMSVREIVEKLEWSISVVERIRAELENQNLDIVDDPQIKREAEELGVDIGEVEGHEETLDERRLRTANESADNADRFRDRSPEEEELDDLNPPA